MGWAAERGSMRGWGEAAAGTVAAAAWRQPAEAASDTRPQATRINILLHVELRMEQRSCRGPCTDAHQHPLVHSAATPTTQCTDLPMIAGLWLSN